MGNQVTNAAEALLKLKRKTGGLAFWLSPVEQGFIDTACGLIVLDSVIVVSGPANITEVAFQMDYVLPAGTVFDIIYAVDGVSKRATMTTHGGLTHSGEALSRFSSEIEAQGGIVTRTDGASNIKDTVLYLDSGSVTNNIDSVSTYGLGPADGVITTPAGTDVIPAEATFNGYFKKGTYVDIQGTTNGVQPLWGLQITLESDYDTVADFVIAAAGFLSGNDGISFVANGDVLEALATFGSTACTIDVLTVTPVA